MSKSVNTRTNEGQTRSRLVARALVQQSAGFRGCQAQTLDALVEAGSLRMLGKGEVLVRQGGGFDTLCLVVAGSLEASVMRRDGHRHLFGYVLPGDMLGIISLLDGLGHVNDLIARMRDTEVLLIPGEVVRRLRDADQGLSRAMELQIAFRSRMLYERMAGDTSVGLDVRLARLLHSLAGLYGLKRPEGIQLGMKISQADLGDFLGVSRQRANFAVQQLKKDGLIELRYSSITISNPDGLAERARI